MTCSKILDMKRLVLSMLGRNLQQNLTNVSLCKDQGKLNWIRWGGPIKYSLATTSILLLSNLMKLDKETPKFLRQLEGKEYLITRLSLIDYTQFVHLKKNMVILYSTKLIWLGSGMLEEGSEESMLLETMLIRSLISMTLVKKVISLPMIFIVSLNKLDLVSV